MEVSRQASATDPEEPVAQDLNPPDLKSVDIEDQAPSDNQTMPRKLMSVELWILGAMFFFATLIFLLDCSIPLGVAGGVPYVIIVMLSGWFRKPERSIPAAAGLGIALSVLGYFLSPPGGVAWMVISNRVLASFVICATAALLLGQRKARQQAHDSIDQVESLVSVYNQTAIGLCYFDSKLRYVHVNDWLATFNGLSAEEHLGRTISEVVPIVAAEIEPQLRQVIESGIPVLRGTVVAETPADPLVQRCFEHNFYPVKSNNGTVVGVSCDIQDITERKQADEALRAAEERYRKLLETLPHGVQECDADGIITYSNSTHSRMHGYEPGDMVGMAIWDMSASEKHRDELRDYLAYLVKAQPTPTPYLNSDRVRGGDNIEIQMDWEYDRDTQGRVVGFISIITDITERNRVEQALSSSNARLNAILDTAADGIISMSEECIISSINPAAERILGYPREEVVGKNVNMFMSEPDAKRHDGYVRHYLTTGVAKIIGSGRELTARRKDGSTLPIDLTVSDLREADGSGFTGIIRDITERKKNERALQQSEAELRREVNRWSATFNSVRDIILVVDHSGRILKANEAARRLLPDVESMDGRFCFEVLHGMDQPLQNCPHCPVRSFGNSSSSGEIRGRDNDTWLHVSCFSIPSETENDAAGVIIARDITEQKRSEAELRLRISATDSASNGILIADARQDDLPIVYVNPAFENITGYTAQEAIGRNSRFLQGSDRNQLHRFTIREALKSGTPVRATLRNYHKDGSLFWNELSISPVFDAEHQLTHFIGIQSDITQRIQSQETLIQRERELAHVARLSTLGVMVAGVAHEIAQPLYAISNYASACCQSLKVREDDSLAQVLQWLVQVSEQTDRCNQIIRRLRDFAQKKPPQHSSVDLNDVARASTQMIAAEARQSRIQVRIELTEPLPQIPADRIQIEQVCVNLIRNALEAMETTLVKERDLLLKTSAKDAVVELSVRDNGQGLSADADQIFDPFFTTKHDGLGVGLAVTRTIVEAHGGRVWATPNSDQGTTFHVSLPIEGDRHENER